MRRLYTLFIVCLLPFCGSAQQLQQVAHPPSTEVYDMLIDKKGFIWIAHNLGVSRYDGISFTNFSNQAQTALSMTDLVEDNYGRIWCHNFNGQVFYIEDDKMVYLAEYDFKIQHIFPRMVLFKDELVITSRTGLFICNTATLKCRNIPNDNYGVAFASTSLCVTKGKVLLFASPFLCTYNKEDGVRRLNHSDFYLGDDESGSAIQPHTFGNLVFIISFRRNTLLGMTLDDSDNLKTSFAIPLRATINTISITGGKIWINTKTGSFPLDGKDSIKGYDLTAIIEDNLGNKWFSSLSNGLLVQYRNTAWQKIKLNAITGNDYARCIQKGAGSLIVCSQYGQVLMDKPGAKGTFDLIYIVPPQIGTTENLQPVDDSDYVLEESKNIYILNAFTRQLRFVRNGNIRDIVVNGSTAYFAASASMMVQDIANWQLNNKGKRVLPFGIDRNLIIKSGADVFLNKGLRCRAVLFDTVTNSLLAAFADGLLRITNKKLTPVLDDGQPLYVSSMVHFGKKIYAATFNNGLFVVDSNKVEKINDNTESPFDGIVKIKCCNNHIWLFRTHDIEVLDAEKDKFINLYPFPVDVSDINDVEEDDKNIYLATHLGLYSIPLTASAGVTRANPLLLYMLVNNADTVYKTGASLSSDRNNLLFRLAIPVYENADKLHFKYRLLNGNPGKVFDRAFGWYYTRDAQRDIQFNALKPGSYALEIIAIKDNEIISRKPLLFHFEIRQPWYGTWWFYTAITLFIVALSFGVQQYRLRQIFKIERVRRKISNDLHDDIGSTLSSINIYSQLARSEKDNVEYINTIQANTVGIINNLDDLVWNINPKNDVFSYLVKRMELFAYPLLNEKKIEYFFKAKADNTQALIAPNVRADIYLMFKEMINNVVKHSNCSECSMYVIQKGRSLRLIVKDNGKGFNIKNISPHRNGLRIMTERVKDMKGNISIKSRPGNGTEIRINCRLK